MTCVAEMRLQGKGGQNKGVFKRGVEHGQQLLLKRILLVSRHTAASKLRTAGFFSVRALRGRNIQSNLNQMSVDD